jgi:hypothetical protein
LLTNEPTAWSRVLIENVIVPEIAKKFPAFYGKGRFKRAFKTPRY